MKYNYHMMKNLFLRQSYLDAWDDYQRSLRKSSFITWDYIVLTASNEDQAESYRQQITHRLDRGLLPERTEYVVLPDPEGKRIGSGGATFCVMNHIAEKERNKAAGWKPTANPFKGKRILVIHSGGDSRRVPQYSACGKLFAPVMRELPNGQSSTLFDEFIIGLSGVPVRMQEGMLVLSGDVLLLFNPLQIDLQLNGAAAISMKAPVETGEDHGVFLSKGNGYVDLFLHKQPEEQLRRLGAVDGQGNVDIDTGAILIDGQMLEALYSLISTDGAADERKLRMFANEKSCVSFYGDFLYPLAEGAVLEDYLCETAEGSLCDELMECRKKLWEALHGFTLKLLCLSPAEFIHFGTTGELTELVTDGIDNYVFLDWKRCVASNVKADGRNAVHTSLIRAGTEIGDHSYIEKSTLGEEVRVGENCVVSGIDISHMEIPDNVVLHGLQMKDGRFVVRIYGPEDNPKGCLGEHAGFLGTDLERFLASYGLAEETLWSEPGEEKSLWNARLYPLCGSMEEAVKAALDVYTLAAGAGKKTIDDSANEGNIPKPVEAGNLDRKSRLRAEDTEKSLARWNASERTSLCRSFNMADAGKLAAREKKLEDRIQTERFLNVVREKKNVFEALDIFGKEGINEERYRLLMDAAGKGSFGEKIRIYYYLSRYVKEEKKQLGGRNYDALESLCFETMGQAVFEEAVRHIRNDRDWKIVIDHVSVRLPVRVNWGGGWTDTPPYCIEEGGVVLNAAIKLKGKLPVVAELERMDELIVRFESTDTEASGSASTVREIQDCGNPYDPFALHKAALVACGIIPREGEWDLRELLQGFGGGLKITTRVEGVPKGSGLGTSSILSAACVKALLKFFGREADDDTVCSTVLSMEQLMSTGGGWQDQVGGLTNGIKLITTKPGISQKIRTEKLEIPEDAMRELSERFVLIYTGQRRLARNLLRDVVGSYISARPETVEALGQMKRTAVLMRYELEQGNIDGFAELLDHHWELSKQLDGGSTNTCIDQIFLACSDLLSAKFIAGAGGGGFLQAILKKGVQMEELSKRLREVFGDSGVDVWDCEFV